MKADPRFDMIVTFCMNNETVYIGVVGQIACGKGVLVDYLIKKLGFTSFSLSSILHRELDKKHNTDVTRTTLQDLGDRLRVQYGRDVLAKRAIKELRQKKIKRVVIEGIRNTAEVEYLKSLPQFTLIGMKSYRRIRFKRLLRRSKPWDPKTWENFLVVDRRDLGIGQAKEGQQVGKCLAYCDYTFTNNKDVWDLHRKVKKLMEKIFRV